ncbi:hypothetical protein GCM10010421_63640 [Streptomyces glaucus]|uniref:Uncharacterized protein n=1 Tax=Streptomyces glaucus TaxID=284029 RepID=A0ABN3KLM3_9ACTN
MSYVDAVHGPCRRPPRDCVTGRFEGADPVRTFRWSRGERRSPGWYRAATTGRHVGFERALEPALPEFPDADSDSEAADEPGAAGRPRSAPHTAIRRPACRRCGYAARITMPVT